MIEKLDGQDLLPDPAEAAPPEKEAPRFGSVEVGSDAAMRPETSRITPAGGEASPGEADAAAETSIVPVEPGELRGAIEAVLFSISEPVTIRSLSDLLRVSVHDVREAVEDLRLEYIDARRAFRIEDIAGGVQMLTLSRYDPWIRRLRQKERESRLSSASLESLAVIAYKQPISRADLEAIRGVGCGPTLKTLLERGLIQIAGRSEALGKPLLYGTTRRFLESFGISSVRELPQPELTERPREEPPRIAAAPAPTESQQLASPEAAAPTAEAEPSITDATGPFS